MTNVVYRKCSGIRLLLPLVLMLFLYCMIDLVEALSPFAGYGNLTGYYQVSIAYVSFGVPLLLSLSLLRYEIYFREDFLACISRIGSLALFFSFVGLCFLAFDRIFIQGVDYSAGVSAARESWREMAASRGGVSSIFSVSGNLMYPLVFIGALIFLVFYDFVYRADLKLVYCFVIIFSFSLLIGGRTSILVFLALILSGCVVRCVLGFSLLPRQLVRWSLFLLFTSFSFSSLIFYWRMAGSSVSFESYALNLALRHNAYVVDHVRGASIFEALIYSLVVYFVHVKWTFQAVLSDVELHGISFFNQIFWIISSRGGIDFGVEFDWTYSGRWISLPGSVWHDYGILGVFIASLVNYSILSFFMLGFIYFKRMSVGFKVSLILLSGVFFAFFVVAPFSSMFEIVEFIYFSFGAILISVWCISKEGLRRLLN